MQVIKIVFLSIAALCVVSSASAAGAANKAQRKRAQYDRLSFGVGVGLGSNLPIWKIPENCGLQSINGKNTVGLNALIDVRYTHFWKRDFDMGITTGLGIGYLNEAYNMAWDETLTTNSNGYPVIYNISVLNTKENLHQLQLEIPVLFSMKMDNGLLLNAGPKLMIPLVASYNQTMISPNISAHYVQENVTVSNEAVTGLVTDDLLKKSGKSGYAGKVQLLLGVDAGYEWELPYHNSISLSGYFDVGVFGAYRHNKELYSILQVTPPTDETPIAKVTVNPVSDVLVDRLSYFDIGLKVAYHINYGKRRARYHSNYTRRSVNSSRKPSAPSQKSSAPAKKSDASKSKSTKK